MKVSVQQLLAHPQKFDGKRVDVTGFYATSNEESRLNTSERVAEASDGIEKSIWLEPDIWDPRFHRQPPPPQIADSKKLEWRPVRVIGTFHYRRRPANANDHRIPYERRWKEYGSYGLWERAISDITYFQPLS